MMDTPLPTTKVPPPFDRCSGWEVQLCARLIDDVPSNCNNFRLGPNKLYPSFRRILVIRTHNSHTLLLTKTRDRINCRCGEFAFKRAASWAAKNCITKCGEPSSFSLQIAFRLWTYRPPTHAYTTHSSLYILQLPRRQFVREGVQSSSFFFLMV